ncbi:MAG: LPS assembly lipoprotein LptE [Pseudomonadota bacterium]
MRRVVALLACCVLVASCSFRLQGRQVLPASLASIELNATDAHSDFTAALKRSITASGAQLVDHATTEQAVLRITRDEVTEDVLSVDARNIPTDFELTYVVEVGVRVGTNELMEAEKFTLSRIYSFDETRLLAKEREKDILREALARDMASIVLRRLSSL